MKKVVFNVTHNVTSAVAQEWLSWMQENYIPKAMECKGFEDFKLLKIVNSEGVDEVFALQFTISSLGHCLYFQDTVRKELATQLKINFGEEVLTFATLMEVVE